MARILAVDNDPLAVEMLEVSLEGCGHEVTKFFDGEMALECLNQRPNDFEVALVDFGMPGLTGEKVVRKIKLKNPNIYVVVVSAEANENIVQACFDAGADQYVTKKVGRDEIIHRILSCIEQFKINNNYDSNVIESVDKLRAKIQKILKKRNGLPMEGVSHALFNVAEFVEKFSKSSESVLVEADPGTGKEAVAWSIHLNSPRSKGPFVTVNCAAIPETLFESELFGHEKGSFSGAIGKKLGLFEEANGGTLFLDEIGELPKGIQSKLLRVLQEKEIRPVGSTVSKIVDVRVVAATNKRLLKEVAAGRFREDLYYRLNVLPIQIPPLKERPEDVEPLAVHFLSEKNKESQTSKQFNRKSVLLLKSHSWPGNVRQLENVIARAYTQADKIIEPSDIVISDVQRNQEFCDLNLKTSLVGKHSNPIGSQIDELERKVIVQNYYHFNGNINEMCSSLGKWSYATLWRRVQKYKKQGFIEDLTNKELKHVTN